jgi:hypothetical protein
LKAASKVGGALNISRYASSEQFRFYGFNYLLMADPNVFKDQPAKTRNKWLLPIVLGEALVLKHKSYILNNSDYHGTGHKRESMEELSVNPITN